VFIITSNFSQGAKDFVNGLNLSVVLVGGHQLAELMIEYILGVSTKETYQVKTLASDYFDGFAI